MYWNTFWSFFCPVHVLFSDRRCSTCTRVWCRRSLLYLILRNGRLVQSVIEIRVQVVKVLHVDDDGGGVRQIPDILHRTERYSGLNFLIILVKQHNKGRNNWMSKSPQSLMLNPFYYVTSQFDPFPLLPFIKKWLSSFFLPESAWLLLIYGHEIINQTSKYFLQRL